MVFPFSKLTDGGLNHYQEKRSVTEGLLVTMENNSLIALSQPVFYNQPKERVKAIITAYSSSLDETWGDPFVTASGERVRNGIVANNCLPFGTLVKINGEYFEVLDRKNSRYGCEWFDIWKPSKQEAINFGIREIQAKILEN